jgi:alanine racemase
MRYNTELQVHLPNLAYNFDLLNKIAPANETIFMVKANAYGHGLLEIVHYAFYELGIKRFGCASLGEAMTIRENFPKMQCELWVFSDTELGIERFKECYLDFNIIPVIHHMEDLKKVVSDKDFSNLPLVIKLDTGMHRLGLGESEISELTTLLKSHSRLTIHHLMTHFANSYKKLKPNDSTNRQYKLFLKIKKEIQNSGISIEETSCANSGSIEQKIGLDESHIRPGLMMYGPSAMYDKEIWPGKTISTFKTKVIKTLPIRKGTPIGYGGHVCGKNGYIAYLPVGYGDGILTYYSGAKFTFLGEPTQILGRVNMDLTAIFFENMPSGLRKGSEFIFWNDLDYDISELATQMKTIPYQLFTAVTSRVPRRYIK